MTSPLRLPFHGMPTRGLCPLRQYLRQEVAGMQKDPLLQLSDVVLRNLPDWWQESKALEPKAGGSVTILVRTSTNSPVETFVLKKEDLETVLFAI